MERVLKETAHFLGEPALGTSFKHAPAHSMCFILPTVDKECDYESTVRPRGSVGFGYTRSVTSQICLTGPLNRWTTLALGGLEATKREQGEDSTPGGGWMVKYRGCVGERHLKGRGGERGAVGGAVVEASSL